MLCSFVYFSGGLLSKYFSNITEILIGGSGWSWYQKEEKENSGGEYRFPLAAQ